MLRTDSPPISSGQNRPLNLITTRWSMVNDPVQIVVRYAPAIRGYLLMLLKDPNEADEVAQDFAMHMLTHRFGNASADRGRFRDYIKVAAKNAAITHLRRKQRGAKLTGEMAHIADTAENDPAANDPWLPHWRQCLLDKVWRRLESRESRSLGNLCYTVLRLAVKHPKETSDVLARMASQSSGREVSAEAFRKQLSRARPIFAELLLTEVAATLKEPSPQRIEEELNDLGLMRFIQAYLPEDWRSRGNPSK